MQSRRFRSLDVVVLILLGLIWVATLLLPLRYEAIATSVLALVYAGLRAMDCFVPQGLSYAAVFSALGALLNPEFVRLLLRPSHLSLVYRLELNDGWSHISSFLIAVVGFVAGLVSLFRILRSHGTLRGLAFSIVGIQGGGYWAGYWLVIFLRFEIPLAGEYLLGH